LAAALRAYRLKKPSITNDLHIRPAIRLKFLPHLVLGNRLIPGNEDRAFARLGGNHGYASYSQKQQATTGQYPPSIHVSPPHQVARTSA
jgi:hypothetical protein